MRALVLVAALAGCGEDTHGGAYVPIQMYNSAYKDAYCTHLVTCGLFTDLDSCRTRTTDNGPVEKITKDLEAAVLAGKVYYDGSKFALCVAAIAKLTCDTTDADGRTPISACSNLFRGELDGGVECSLDVECISQTCARNCGELTCCQGTCVGDTPPLVTPPSAIGQNCDLGSCVANAYCDANTQLCTALKPVSAPCTTSNECAFGLGCVPSSPTLCLPLPTLGEPCPQFVAPLCRDEGQFCDMTTQTCRAVGLPGAACDPFGQNGDVNGGCSLYYRCDVTTSTCVPYPAVGEPCTQALQCANDINVFCGDGIICTTKPNVGEPCSSPAEVCAVGLVCDDAFRCAVPPTCI